jgi:hypothetical protein
VGNGLRKLACAPQISSLLTKFTSSSDIVELRQS